MVQGNLTDENTAIEYYELALATFKSITLKSLLRYAPDVSPADAA